MASVVPSSSQFRDKLTTHPSLIHFQIIHPFIFSMWPLWSGFTSLLISEGSLDVVSIAVFVALICACIVIGHLLEENRWANESIISLLLGLCAGLATLVCTRWTSSRILVFNAELFFIYMLPPIIFNAGFQVKKKKFFQNFSTILLFGVLGTLISFCVISTGSYFLFKVLKVPYLKIRDYLAIGAIFSATDSVCTLQVLSQEETPLLYSLVFGEGVVNDATSIVLFNAVQTLNINNFDAMTALRLLGSFLRLFITSTALGIAVGLTSAYVIKKLYFGRHSTEREVALMLLLAYLSYIISELFSLSGILTIFFCGIIMSHYTWHNITERSRVTTKHSFATMSFISETFIFLYVGMDALDIEKWKTSEASVGTSIVVSGTLITLIMVGRAASVFSLANIANCFGNRSRNKTDLRQQFIIWWAGLMRGAVTIALSYNKFSTLEFPTSAVGAFMITSTIIVVLFSTLVFGFVTKPLIQATLTPHLKFISNDSLDDRFLPSEIVCGNNDPYNDLDARHSLSLIVTHPSSIHYFWRKFDDRYMRPVFGGHGFTPIAPGSPRRAEENA